MTGATEMLSPELAALYNEYSYRRIFPATTHDEYLDTPGDRVRWMLEIHRVVQSVEGKVRQ